MQLWPPPTHVSLLACPAPSPATMGSCHARRGGAVRLPPSDQGPLQCQKTGILVSLRPTSWRQIAAQWRCFAFPWDKLSFVLVRSPIGIFSYSECQCCGWYSNRGFRMDRWDCFLVGWLVLCRGFFWWCFFPHFPTLTQICKLALKLYDHKKWLFVFVVEFYLSYKTTF